MRIIDIEFRIKNSNMIKCSICGRDENSLLKVKHRKLGTTKICFECWETENGNNNILPSCGRCN